MPSATGVVQDSAHHHRAGRHLHRDAIDRDADDVIAAGGGGPKILLSDLVHDLIIQS